MPTKEEMLIEASERGLLDPEKQAAFNEAVRRGLIKQQTKQFSITTQFEELPRPLHQFASPLPPDQIAEQEGGLGSLIGGVAGAFAGEAALTQPIRAAGKSLQAAPVPGTPGVVTKSAGKALDVGAPIVASGIGAFAGGSAGEFGETVTEIGIENAPIALKRAVDAGQDEAVFDIMANTVLRGGAGGIKLLKERFFKGDPAVRHLMQELSEQGTNLTLDQAVTNTGIKTLGEVLRGGLLSPAPFEAVTRKQEKALLRMVDNFLEDAAGVAAEELTPAMAGRLVQQSFTDNKALHSELASTLFGELDNLPVLTARADGVFRPPVDVSRVRSFAASAVDDIQRIGTPDITAQGNTILRRIAQGDEALTFRETHTLISDLKRLQRSGNAKDLPSGVKIGALIKEAEKAFAQAGDRLPGEANAMYKQARKFWKFGEDRVKNDFIKSLVTKEPTEIGKAVAKASPENLIKLRQMFKAGDAISRRAGVERSSRQIWDQVRLGALEEMLPRNIEQIGTAKIAKRATNKDVSRTLNVLLNKKERATFNQGVGLLEDMLKNTNRTGRLVSREIGAAALAGGAIVSTTSGDPIPASVMAILVTPRLLAGAMTDPKFVKALVAFDKTPVGNLAAFNAATKLTIEGDRILEEFGVDF